MFDSYMLGTNILKVFICVVGFAVIFGLCALIKYNLPMKPKGHI